MELEAYNNGLENIVIVAKELNCLQENIKPCIATILNNPQGIKKGNRDNVAYMLATELRRMSIDADNAGIYLLDWNKELSEPLPMQTIKSKIKSAYKKEQEGYFIKGGYKTYFCDGFLGEFCVADKETCLFRQLNSPKRASISGRGTGIPTFVMLGWWKRLNGGEIKVYCGLCELEKRKGVKAGQRMFCSQFEIARVSGVSKPTVPLALSDLFFEGLILYKKGEQHYWKHKAGEIQRVVPIPRINQRKPYADISNVMTMSKEEDNLTKSVRKSYGE